MPQVLSVPSECPKCGGKMWDNRLSKRNPKAPDFKCRDRSCDGVIWSLKKGEIYADQVNASGPLATTVKKVVQQVDEDFDPYAEPLPGQKGRTDTRLPVSGTNSQAPTHESLEAVFHVYAACFTEAAQYSTDPKVQPLVAAAMLTAACKNVA